MIKRYLNQVKLAVTWVEWTNRQGPISLWRKTFSIKPIKPPPRLRAWVEGRSPQPFLGTGLPSSHDSNRDERAHLARMGSSSPANTHTHIYVYMHMCTHIHTRMCAHMHTHIYTCRHTYTHMHTHTHACACAHIHMCGLTCTHARAHIHTFMHTRMCMHTCAHIHACVRTHMCRHTYTLCVHAHMYAHTYMHACTHTHMCACTYTHACTHTYTHARTHTCFLMLAIQTTCSGTIFPPRQDAQFTPSPTIGALPPKSRSALLSSQEDVLYN